MKSETFVENKAVLVFTAMHLYNKEIWSIKLSGYTLVCLTYIVLILCEVWMNNDVVDDHASLRPGLGAPGHTQQLYRHVGSGRISGFGSANLQFPVQ